MAAKKENKAIGNLVIAVIPLIGVIWAAVAGIQHNGFVKDVKKAEDAFEIKMVEKINSLELSKENNIVVKDLNLTSVVPSFHATKLRNDKVSKNNSSYTVRLSANPTILTNDKNEKYVEEFQLNFEFFIDSDSYENLLTSYAQGKNVLVGYEDYIFTTYNKDNPKNSVIYALEPLFDAFYENVLFYEYDNEVIFGLSSSLVIDMIDEIPEVLNAVDSELKAYNNILKEIETQFVLLNETQQTEVKEANYNKYLEAKSLYNAKVVEYTIDSLKSCNDSSEYTLSLSTAVDNAKKAYDKLTASEKELVQNVAKLEENVFIMPVYKAEYYVLQYEKQASDQRIKNAVKFFNELSAEQKAAYNSTILSKLETYIAEYNAKVSENNKLSLNK